VSDYKLPPITDRLDEEPEAEPEPSRSKIRPVWIIVLIAALGFSTALLFLTLSGTSVTQLSIPSLGKIETRSRIAFIDSEGQLGTISPDGSDLRMLTDDERNYHFPAWAPDSPTVAVIGSDLEGGGLYATADQANAELRQLYAHPERGPVYHFWSPDGDSLSFIAPDRQGIALHLVPEDGIGGSRIVSIGSTSFFWDWMPDSEGVLIHTGFTGDPNAQTRLAIIPIQGESQETEVKGPGFFQAPSVAFDGKYYAFASVDPIGIRWLTVHLTSNGFTQWLQPHLGVAAIGWSPTDLQLAYISPPDNRPSFYGSLKLYDLAQDDLRELVDRTVLAFFWAPDGRSIAYITLENFERGAERNLVELGLWVVNPDDGQGRQLMSFQPTDVFADELLPFFDNYAQSHSIWAPDSHAVVIPTMDDDGRDQIVVVPMDGGEPLTIIEGVSASWSRQ
jgi:TolB protein